MSLTTWLALTAERCPQDEKEGVKAELVVAMAKKFLMRDEKESHRRRKECENGKEA